MTRWGTFLVLLSSALGHFAWAQTDLKGGQSQDLPLTSVWTWTDAQGATVFSDAPPKKGQIRATLKKITQPSSMAPYENSPKMLVSQKPTSPLPQEGRSSVGELPPLPPIGLPPTKR